jgi:hypothetical protein
VRACPEDLFETLHPLESLDGFSNLRRRVVSQEAMMWVSDRLWSTSATDFENPTQLLPVNIESVEIIDSTSALQHCAAGLLNMWMGKAKVSSLRDLNKLVLWCDHFYPTLVPDYRTDSWKYSPRDHYCKAGRGGRESNLLLPGRYGEKSGVEHCAPPKTDKTAEAEMRTVRKLKLNLKSSISRKMRFPCPRSTRNVNQGRSWSM